MSKVILSNDDGATWRTLASFGLMMQEGHANDMIPAMAARTVEITGMPGLVYFGTQTSEKSFNLPLAFSKAKSRIELQLSVRDFIPFMIDGKGQPRAIRMKFDYELDKYYTVYYAGKLPLERVINFGIFILPLVAYDPIAYLTQNVGDINVDSDLIVDCDLRIDDEFSFSSITGEITVTINNFGALNVRPIITITGSFTTLTIEANGDTLTYSEALSNNTLTLDLKKRTAKVGATNKNSVTSGTWPELLAGDNEVTISGTGLNCSVSFVFQTQYL